MWFAITIISIWVCGTLATIFSKDSQCMGASLIATVVIGIGFFLLKDNK
jgi:hypothetical protein